jgi:aspartate aminotransferase
MSAVDLADPVDGVHASVLHRVFRRVEERRRAHPDQRVVPLHVGEPAFAPLIDAGEAMERAVRERRAGYCDAGGIAELRDALCEKVRSDNLLSVTPELMFVGPGSTQLLLSLFRALTRPGDVVLLPRPYWPIYVHQCGLLGVTPAFYDVGSDGALDLEALAWHGRRAKVLVLNSPSNPQGAVLDRSTFERALELAHRHGWQVVSDEAYEDFVFVGDHISPASIEAEAGRPNRVSTLFSFSKTYGLTGLRLGYLATPTRQVADAVRRVQEASIVAPSTPAQYAGLAALATRHATVAANRELMAHSRDVALPQLVEAGLLDAPPAGGWYALGRIPAGYDGDAEFAEVLFDETGVAVVEGSAFGVEDGFRIALCARPDDVAEGVRAICSLAR